MLDDGESEVCRAEGEEGSRGGTLFLKETIETVLLAFLTDDGAEDWDDAIFVRTVGCEDGLSCWEDAEGDVGEGIGKGNRGLEGIHGELVFAWAQGFLPSRLEDTVDSNGMKLLLLMEVSDGLESENGNTYCDHGFEGFDHISWSERREASEVVARLIPGDVLQETLEEGDFELFIDGE